MCSRLSGIPAQLPEELMYLSNYPALMTVTCLQCGEIYCSTLCRDKAQLEYHRYLCTQGDVNHPIRLMEEMWKQGHYPPETTTPTIILRMLMSLMIHQGPNPHPLESFKSLIMDDGTSQPMVRILQEEYGERLEKLRNAMEMIFSIYLKQYPKLYQYLSPEGFKTLMTIVALNGQGIGTSSLEGYMAWCRKMGKEDGGVEYYEDAIENVSGEFTHVEGVGVYAIHSKLNHACGSRLGYDGYDSQALSAEIRFSNGTSTCEGIDRYIEIFHICFYLVMLLFPDVCFYKSNFDIYKLYIF